jgi:hypothetical protein
LEGKVIGIRKKAAPMKRLLLTVFMAISGLLLSGFAAQAGTPLTQGGFSYEILPDNTASILKCVDNCSATDLVIPATLGEVPVTKIADSAFLGDATNSLKGRQCTQIAESGYCEV